MEGIRHHDCNSRVKRKIYFSFKKNSFMKNKRSLVSLDEFSCSVPIHAPYT